MNSQTVLALIEAHLACDRKRFADLAAQLAHHEKRLGRSIGDRILAKMQTQSFELAQLPVGGHSRDDLFDVLPPAFRLEDLVLSPTIEVALCAILLLGNLP